MKNKIYILLFSVLFLSVVIAYFVTGNFGTKEINLSNTENQKKEPLSEIKSEGETKKKGSGPSGALQSNS
jgi:hypothetical protein